MNEAHVRLDYVIDGKLIHQEYRTSPIGVPVSLYGTNSARVEVRISVLTIGPKRQIPECVACPHCGGYVRGHHWISANACSVSRVPRKELGLMPETPCRKAPECGVWWHVPFPEKEETASGNQG